MNHNFAYENYIKMSNEEKENHFMYFDSKIFEENLSDTFDNVQGYLLLDYAKTRHYFYTITENTIYIQKRPLKQ